jgi:alpha-1,3-fucosyltransferase
MNLSDLPNPGWRRPHQHFIFFEVEAPTHVYKFKDAFFRNYFNRTMTYRRDSDVVYLKTHCRVRCNRHNASSTSSTCWLSFGDQ